MRLGRVAFRSSGGSSPAFLAALNSAFFRARSWSSIAALTFFETIFINLLLIFRSQYPERPPSSRGIQPQRKKTKNMAAKMRDSMENAQITRVKSMPDRIRACWKSCSASSLILPKKFSKLCSKLSPSIASLAVYTEYSVMPLTACRGPEQKMTRIQAVTVSVLVFRRGGWSVQTLEAEVGEKGDVLGPLLTLCQLCKDQESSPSFALSHSRAFQADSQVVQV